MNTAQNNPSPNLPQYPCGFGLTISFQNIPTQENLAKSRKSGSGWHREARGIPALSRCVGQQNTKTGGLRALEGTPF